MGRLDFRHTGHGLIQKLMHLNYKKSFFRKSIFFLLVGVAVTAPYSITLNSLLVIICTLLAIVNLSINRSYHRLTTPLFFLAVGLYMLNFYGLIFSENLSYAYTKMETQLGLLIFPILFFSIKLTPREIKSILFAFFLSCLIFSILTQIDSLIRLYTTPRHNFSEHYFTWWYTHKNLIKLFNIHPSYLGIYIVFGINIGFHLIKNKFFTKTRGGNVLLILGIIYLSFFVVQLAAKVSLILLVFSIFFGVIYLAHAYNKLYLGALSAIVLVLIIIFFFLNVHWALDRFLITFDNIKNMSFQNSRLGIWMSAWEQITSNWLFGVGTGDVKAVMAEAYKSNDLNTALDREYNTHNEFLNYLLRFGIIGIITLLLNLAAPLYRCSKNGTALGVCFSIIIIVFFMTENVLSTQKGVVFFSFFNSLFLSQSLKIKPDSAH